MFFERFIRYGRANAMLEKKYSASFLPRRQKVNSPNYINYLLAKLQYLVTLTGYFMEKI